MDFHQAIASEILPIIDELNIVRKKGLGVDSLRPWDTVIDVSGEKPTSPFDDEKELIEKIKQPALLIRGAKSSQFVAPIHAAINRRLEGSKSISIENAGHMVPITHPKAVADQIVSFLDAVPV